MNILFICSCLEEGKDGVGDYTRRLAGELIAQGHDIAMLSINDKYVENVINGEQSINDVFISTLRLPSSFSYREKKAFVIKWIKKQEPDCLSLQYVPYGFQRKGLPLGLTSFLESISANKPWHIMFHELWIGMNSKASLKSRLIGIIQKRLILQMVYKLKPFVTTTHAEVYQWSLMSSGIPSKIFPLFSNISNIGCENSKQDDFIHVAIFGSIFPNVPYQEFINEVANYQSKFGVLFKFLFIGRNGKELDAWVSTCLSKNVEYEVIGEVSNREVSKLIASCDLGITTTPYILTQKSGVVASLIEHFLPIICVSFDWDVTGFKFENKAVFQYKKGNFQTIFEEKSMDKSNFIKYNISSTFLGLLSD